MMLWFYTQLKQSSPYSSLEASFHFLEILKFYWSVWAEEGRIEYILSRGNFTRKPANSFGELVLFWNKCFLTLWVWEYFREKNGR